MDRQHQEVHDLEEYSIETPCPPEFQSYEVGAGTVSFQEASSNEVDQSDEYVRHGRSPRFWLLVAGAVVLVVAAVGGGVGAAMAGGGSSAPAAASVPSSSGSSSHSHTVEEEMVEQVFEGVSEESKENKETAQVGGVVQLGGSSGSTPSPTSEVFDIILSHSRYHGIEFQDPNSYQSKAARWVEETSKLGVHTPQRLVQRYALAALYYATNGVANIYTKEIFGTAPTRGWIDETGWLDAEDECSWYRVTCNADGEVTKIELYSNRLTGSLPPEIALLHESLEVIDLYQNMLHNKGDTGNHFLGELTNLRQLYFGRTYFEYPGIPTAIGSLTNLQEFDCSYTLYHGPLKAQAFQSLQKLEYLHMGGNRYNSSIPVELAALPKLQYVYAEYADLRGNLSFVRNMSSVIEFWIDRNPMIKGAIPSEIGMATNLKSFSVTGCGLEGKIPTELASLRLQQFWAYNNSLTGTIPTEFANLGELVRLGLEANKLQGEVAPGICENRVPNGLLAKLETDCQQGGPVYCSCCTCCGPECSGGTSTGTRKLAISS